MHASDLTMMLAVLRGAGLANAPAPSKDMATSWAAALDDVRPEDAVAAARLWVKNERWWPTPSDIRAIALDRQGDHPSSSAAWALVQPEVYAKQKPPDVAMLALKDVGGIYAVRTTDNSNRLRDQFMRAYQDRLRDARESVAEAHTTAALDGRGDLAQVAAVVTVREAQP